MNKFLLICTRCADFFSPDGEKFRITPPDLGVIVEAPEWIKKTLMFKLLEKDGSVQYVTRENKKELENEPMKGITAEGKKEEAAKPVEVVIDEPIIKTRKRSTAKKKD